MGLRPFSFSLFVVLCAAGFPLFCTVCGIPLQDQALDRRGCQCVCNHDDSTPSSPCQKFKALCKIVMCQRFRFDCSYCDGSKISSRPFSVQSLEVRRDPVIKTEATRVVMPSFSSNGAQYTQELVRNATRTNAAITRRRTDPKRTSFPLLTPVRFKPTMKEDSTTAVNAERLWASVFRLTLQKDNAVHSYFISQLIQFYGGSDTRLEYIYSRLQHHH